MKFDALDTYSAQAESQRLGLRGVIGRTITFAGFIVLANAFIIALLFRHLLSFQTQVVFASAGAVVGLTGMMVRGNTRTQVTAAVIASTSTIAATIIVSFLEERFGLWILVGIVVVLGLAYSKI